MNLGVIWDISVRVSPARILGSGRMILFPFWNTARDLYRRIFGFRPPNADEVIHRLSQVDLGASVIDDDCLSDLPGKTIDDLRHLRALLPWGDGPAGARPARPQVADLDPKPSSSARTRALTTSLVGVGRLLAERRMARLRVRRVRPIRSVRPVRRRMGGKVESLDTRG